MLGSKGGRIRVHRYHGDKLSDEPVARDVMRELVMNALMRSNQDHLARPCKRQKASHRDRTNQHRKRKMSETLESTSRRRVYPEQKDEVKETTSGARGVLAL